MLTPMNGLSLLPEARSGDVRKIVRTISSKRYITGLKEEPGYPGSHESFLLKILDAIE